jgi:DNA-binding NtrC family response regulator
MSIKILIVDDEEIILEEVAETLTDEGYECFVAATVDDAVDIVESTPGIIVIVTDLRMPKKTGADLIKIVEAKWGQNIKIIVMSGHGTVSSEKSSVDLTLYPFLKKPLNINSLLEAVDSVSSPV